MKTNVLTGLSVQSVHIFYMLKIKGIELSFYFDLSSQVWVCLSSSRAFFVLFCYISNLKFLTEYISTPNC